MKNPLALLLLASAVSLSACSTLHLTRGSSPSERAQKPSAEQLGVTSVDLALAHFLKGEIAMRNVD